MADGVITEEEIDAELRAKGLDPHEFDTYMQDRLQQGRSEVGAGPFADG